MPLERVLVATDFSPSADRAVARTALLPLAPGARVLLLHVLPARLPAAVRARARAEAEQELEETAGALQGARGRPRSPVDTEVRAGDAFAEILGAGRAFRADLTVVGRHGRKPIRDLFLGSTAERVIRHGTGPVLLVNRRVVGPYRRPLLALDADRVFARALAFAPRVVAGAPLGLVHAYEAPLEMVALDLAPAQRLEYRRQLRAIAARRIRRLLEETPTAAAREAPVLREGPPATVILREAARRRSDLLILGSRGRSGLGYLLLGSVAAELIREAACDVLVVRPDRAASR